MINKQRLFGFLNNFNFKIGLVIFVFVCFVTSASFSAARYIQKESFNNDAGIASFGTWSVEYKNTPINIPDEVGSNGIYAFVAQFRVVFSEGEVKRAYTLKVKDVEGNVSSNQFNSVNARENSFYYLSESTNVWTTQMVDGSSTIIKSGVASLLTNSRYTTFQPGKIYMSYSEGQTEEDAINYGWNEYESSSMVDGDALCIESSHAIEAKESDFHEYKIVYFMNVNVSNVEDFKFIYSLQVEQVM